MAFGTLMVASLQGRVLCYSPDGRHFALETPHEDTGCPSRHERHEESDGEHAPHPTDCTDISADVAVIREVTSASSIDLANPLAVGAPALSSVLLTAPRELTAHPQGASGQPPAWRELACLRTVVLLV